jgi:hypothetical protein
MNDPDNARGIAFVVLGGVGALGGRRGGGGLTYNVRLALTPSTK